jgi:hypothetical protein
LFHLRSSLSTFTSCSLFFFSFPHKLIFSFFRSFVRSVFRSFSPSLFRSFALSYFFSFSKLSWMQLMLPSGSLLMKLGTKQNLYFTSRRRQQKSLDELAFNKVKVFENIFIANWQFFFFPQSIFEAKNLRLKNWPIDRKLTNQEIWFTQHAEEMCTKEMSTKITII